MAQLLESLHHSPSSSILVPPREFSKVEHDLFASSLPHGRSVPFLTAQKVRSVLFLCPKQHPLDLNNLPQETRTWIDSLEDHHWIHVDKIKGYGKIVITQAGAKAALEYLLTARRPLLISGWDQVETCGLVVACLRKLQCWDMSSIQDELSRSVSVSLDAMHLRFVNTFRSSLPPPYLAGFPVHVQRFFANDPAIKSMPEMILDLPKIASLPSWLWAGAVSPQELLGYPAREEDDGLSPADECIWHPTMRVRLPAVATFRRTIRPQHGAGSDVEATMDLDALPTPRCASLRVSPERVANSAAKVV